MKEVHYITPILLKNWIDVKLNSEHFIPTDFLIKHLNIEIFTRTETAKKPNR